MGLDKKSIDFDSVLAKSTPNYKRHHSYCAQTSFIERSFQRDRHEVDSL